jgi:NodT family efflux transporter outer membrane factor (OMF) lipoprotein
MVGPNYKKPAPNLTQDWQKENAEEVSFLKEEPSAEWWKVFQDPLLTKYIELGQKNNKDLLRAEANILKARALRQVAASKFYPQVDFDANGSRTEYSKNGPIVTEVGNAAPTAHAFQLQNLFNSLFDVSWELDLFGKTRRSVQAAKATIESTIEQKNNLLISLMGEIARNYIEIRSFQKQKELVEKNISILELSTRVLKKSFADGYKNLLDLDSHEAELAKARADLPNLIAQIYQNIYALAALTGEIPETFITELLFPQPLPKIPTEVAIGIRSDLLRRRPDIRKAERDLAATVANIGVAVADFYPTVVLGLNAGLQSLKLSNFFQLNSKTWMVGGDIGLPIFKGGKLVGNLKVSRAESAMAAFGYQQTILNALAETESAIKNYNEDIATSKSQKVSVEKNRSLVRLSDERYKKGLVDIIDFLTYEQKLIASEKILLDDDTKSLLDVVILYKSLGGGWQTAKESHSLLNVLDSCTVEKKDHKKSQP